LDVVGSARLMQLTSGNADVIVGLIDGPVFLEHPDLNPEHIRGLKGGGACAVADSIACAHGTFIAGILSGRRASAAPGLCPGCTVLVRPVFLESSSAGQDMPSATPDELAAAILECIAANSRILNLSLGLDAPTSRSERNLERALDLATRRGVLVVAAAGNQGTLGGTSITRHPWVIPVAACDGEGRPAGNTNLSSSIGRRGISAPGDRIAGLAPDGSTVTRSGTSIAAALVTGAIALLWSLFPTATAAQVKLAVTQAGVRRRSVVPPVLDAWTAYETLANAANGPNRNHRKTFQKEPTR
jgi:subtilisin family serine protease